MQVLWTGKDITIKTNWTYAESKTGDEYTIEFGPEDNRSYVAIRFKNKNVTGVTVESLLSVLVHRLECVQKETNNQDLAESLNSLYTAVEHLHTYAQCPSSSKLEQVSNEPSFVEELLKKSYATIEILRSIQLATSRSHAVNLATQALSAYEDTMTTKPVDTVVADKFVPEQWLPSMDTDSDEDTDTSVATRTKPWKGWLPSHDKR